MKNPETDESSKSDQPVGRSSGLSLERATTILDHSLMVHGHATSKLSELCLMLAGDFDLQHLRTIASSAGMEWASFEAMLDVGRDRKHICHELAAEWEEVQRLAAKMKKEKLSKQETH